MISFKVLNISFFNHKIYFSEGLDIANDKKNDKISEKIKAIDNEIIKALKDNAYITIPQLADSLLKLVATIHRHLDYLSNMGIIERIGSRKPVIGG